MNTRPPKRLHPVNIRMDDDLLEKLKKISTKQKRSVSNLVYMIVAEWVEAHDTIDDNTGNCD